MGDARKPPHGHRAALQRRRIGIDGEPSGTGIREELQLELPAQLFLVSPALEVNWR